MVVIIKEFLLSFFVQEQVPVVWKNWKFKEVANFNERWFYDKWTTNF